MQKRLKWQCFFLPIFTSIGQSSGDNTAESTLKHRGRLGREQYCSPKNTKTPGEISAIWFGGREEYIPNHKKTFWPYLQFVCVSTLDSPPVILRASNLSQRSWQREHKQPYSKINTAILCVFTFHPAISIWESAPQTVPFHFTPRGRTLFLGPLYRWTSEISSAIILHNHVYLVPFSLVRFSSCMLNRLHAKRWGWHRNIFMKTVYCCYGERRHSYAFLKMCCDGTHIILSDWGMCLRKDVLFQMHKSHI